MIRVTFYRNGFEIGGHARPDICGEVSILAWSFANLVQTEDPSAEWYTSDYDDKPDAGYSFLLFDPSVELAAYFVRAFHRHLRSWSEAYEWQTHGHVEIVDSTRDTLTVDSNFRELLGIV